jgi:hypothetical protein
MMDIFSTPFLCGMIFSIISIVVPEAFLVSIVCYWVWVFDYYRTPPLPLPFLDLNISFGNRRRKGCRKEKNAQHLNKNISVPTLRVRDSSGKFLPVNSEKPVPFESEYFKGHLLVLIRCEGQLERYNYYRDHFKGRQRFFEIQIQGHFKSKPTGALMMGGEVDGVIKLSGGLLGTVANILLSLCSRLIANTHYSYGEEPVASGLYERAHMCFPLFKAMDRVVVTPAGQDPPEMGKDFTESDAARAERRKLVGGDNARVATEAMYERGGRGATYSFSFHSSYVDFANWKVSACIYLSCGTPLTFTIFGFPTACIACARCVAFLVRGPWTSAPSSTPGRSSSSSMNWTSSPACKQTALSHTLCASRST